MNRKDVDIAPEAIKEMFDLAHSGIVINSDIFSEISEKDLPKSGVDWENCSLEKVGGGRPLPPTFRYVVALPDNLESGDK